MADTWYDNSSEPYHIFAGHPYSKPICIHVDPGLGGTVEMQFQDASGGWYTPPVYKFTEKGPVFPDWGNLPKSRIKAVGDAKFQVFK